MRDQVSQPYKKRGENIALCILIITFIENVVHTKSDRAQL